MNETMNDTSRFRQLRCPYCGKRGALRMSERHTTGKPSPVLNFFAHLFSLGGISLNDRFTCAHCGKEIKQIPFLERVLVPALFIGGSVFAVIIFLSLILFMVD